MKKVAHYRRARWLGQSAPTLGSVIANSLSGVDSNVAPVFPFADGLDCLVARRALDGQPIFLQLVTYEAGAPAAVIPAALTGSVVDADTADPPPGQEYIDSQLFCVVRDNHVVWTAHNSPMREGPINSLIARLISHFGGSSAPTQFELQAILDKDAFRSAMADGIAEIDLGVGDFQPVLEALLSPSGPGPWAGLLSLISTPPTDDEVNAAANVNSKLVLRPGKSWDKPFVKELLAGVGSNVMDGHEDQFAIETKSGLRLTRDKMAVHKEYEVTGNKQILDPVAVRSALAGVLSELDNSNLLED